MKKAYYIVNLSSGKSAIGAKLGYIIDLFTQKGIEPTLFSTRQLGDTMKAAKAAAESGDYDYIFCSGGDGTLSDTIDGVVASGVDIPIGYIPSGSTNDFARSIGIPLDIEKAANALTTGKPISCDVGLFDGKAFMYVAAFGAFTAISYETPQVVKNALGHTAYVLNGIANIGKLADCSCKMQVEYTDENDREYVIRGEFIYGMVTNSSSVAGFLSLDGFLYDDGTFEVTLIKNPKNLMELGEIVTALTNAISPGSERDSFIAFKAKKARFTVLSDKKVAWTRDGEFGGDAKVHEIENVRRAVSVIVEDPPKNKFLSLSDRKAD